MLIVLLLLLAAVAAAALALLWLVVRGHNKRLLLAGSHAVASDTPDGIGISVLCSGVRAQEQVENLLSAEYAHYEVIVVLDSLRYPVEFAAFTARYRMIRVEYVLSEELPVTGVRWGVRASAVSAGWCWWTVRRILPPAISMRRPKWPLTITCCRCGRGSFCCRTLSCGWWPKWGSGASEGAIACVRGSESLPRC